MRYYLLSLMSAGLLFSACQTHQEEKISALEEKVLQLEQKLEEAEQYRESLVPGLANYMLSAQAHHAKLYYAGTEKNWELVHYNIHEIEELVEDLEKHHPIHDGVKIGKLAEAFLKPGIEQIEAAEEAQDLSAFKDAFEVLTAGCNNCHQQAGYDIINIKVPSKKEFGNQDFK